MTHIPTWGCPWLGQLLGTMWTSRGCAELSLPLTCYGALESWLPLSPATAVRRVGPVPHPDSTMGLTLVGVLVSQSQGGEGGRAELTIYLLWLGTGSEVMLLLHPPQPPAVRKAGPRGHEHKRASPATLPGGGVGAEVTPSPTRPSYLLQLGSLLLPLTSCSTQESWTLCLGSTGELARVEGAH